MGERIQLSQISFRDLQRMAENEKGQLRFKKGMVYISSAGKPNVIKRLVDNISGYTAAKRSAGVTAVQMICSKYGLKFSDLMLGAGLSPSEVDSLRAGRRDLTDDELRRALSRFVQVEDKAYLLCDSVGKGGFAEVRKATHGEKEIALRTFIAPTGGDLSKLPKKRMRAEEVFRREVEVHQFAYGRPLAGEPNYVMPTQGVVEGPGGMLYQVMPLASAGAPDRMEQNMKAAQVAASFAKRAPTSSGQAALEPRPLTQGMLNNKQDDLRLRLVWLDGLKGVQQIHDAGIVHRDLKRGNYLLDRDGTWKITDFGTSGAENTQYQATPGKANSLLTGNETTYSKAPEWLEHEQKHSSARFNVGPQCDIFAYGVMMFEDLTNGRRPFDGTPDEPGEWLGPTEYGENVRAYAESGLSFSAWYQQHTGLKIPEALQSLFDMTLHADAAKRPAAEQLRQLDLFQDPQLDDPKLRQDMVSKFSRNT